jgi:hypothetical protein
MGRILIIDGDLPARRFLEKSVRLDVLLAKVEELLAATGRPERV